MGILCSKPADNKAGTFSTEVVNIESVIVRDEDGPVLLGSNKNDHSRALIPPNSPKSNTAKKIVGLHITLVPHAHSLFCERKQRVCQAANKIQELERLKICNTGKSSSGVWLRSAEGAGKDSSAANFSTISGSENMMEYQITVEDVNCLISYRQTDQGVVYADAPIGPVLAGPPRLLDMEVSGSFKVGGRAVAVSDYIGGYEGSSEYWWIRIRDGNRETLGEARAVVQSPASPSKKKKTDKQQLSALSDNDPRVHVITAEDVGCVLKAKCRPVRRGDGHKGEVFTSKATPTITAD